MPFDSPELLSQAGYDSGDNLILHTFQGDDWDASTTSTSFTNVVATQDRLNLDPAPFPTGPSYRLGVTATLSNDTSGETTSLRLNGGAFAEFPGPTISVVEGTDGATQTDTMSVDMSAASKGVIRADMKVTAGTGSLSRNPIIFLTVDL